MSDDIHNQDASTSRGTGSDVEDQAAPESGNAGSPAVPDVSTEVVAAAPPAAATGDQPAAGPLTPADLQRVAELSRQVDVSDTQAVLAFGLPAQSRIANFADSLLGDVRTRDAGTGGEALQDMLKKVREIDVDALSSGSGKAKIPILGRFANTFERFSARYQKVATSLEKIIDALERSRMSLLKDMTVLDKMYELNLDYLKQLDVYIAAGEQALAELHTVRIPALEAEVTASGDVMAAQRLADLQQAATRFERRLHDLKLTRMIAIQTAPQIRLIQSNDQNLVEKIQSSILTTIPLWKNQIVIAISLYRQQKAAELQKQVTDTTNELLAKNAELLREGSAKVGREVERGVVDVETLQKVNADLIATLEETIQIQEEGRTRRAQAEGEIGRMQVELKQKLLELRSQAPQIGAVDEPRRLTDY
jgi:uncharacterized protein YaaN involved in tellurite resistance